VSVADILWRANILAISFTLQQGKIHKIKIFLEEQKFISCSSFATPTTKSVQTLLRIVDLTVRRLVGNKRFNYQIFAPSSLFPASL
jgi:hypothetical protein